MESIFRLLLVMEVFSLQRVVEMLEEVVVSWQKITGEGNGNPLQYSCLENPMDRGAWWATVHRLQRVSMTERLSKILINDN